MSREGKVGREEVCVGKMRKDQESLEALE